MRQDLIVTPLRRSLAMAAALAGLASLALVCAADPAAAAPPSNHGKSCHDKYVDCQGRCVRKYGDKWGDCVERTCNKQFDNCIIASKPDAKSVDTMPKTRSVRNPASAPLGGAPLGGGLLDPNPGFPGQGPAGAGSAVSSGGTPAPAAQPSPGWVIR